MPNCETCRKPYQHPTARAEDLDRAFDFHADWTGLPTYCPHCGARAGLVEGKLRLQTGAKGLRAIVDP